MRLASHFKDTRKRPLDFSHALHDSMISFIFSHRHRIRSHMFLPLKVDKSWLEHDESSLVNSVVMVKEKYPIFCELCMVWHCFLPVHNELHDKETRPPFRTKSFSVSDTLKINLSSFNQNQ